MALPSDLQTEAIVGDYVDYNGALNTGTIEFSAAVRLISSVTHTAVSPAVVVGKVDTLTGALKAADGTSPLRLIATDDPDVTPTGWTWTVTEKLQNAAGVNISKQPFNLNVPLGSGPIDLPSASPSTPPVTPGTTAVTKVNSVLPNGAGVVTLVPGDVGAAPLVHVHDGSAITAGTVVAARLPIGTTASTVAAGDDSRIAAAVQSSRQVIAGTGLTGGGDLSANRTLAVAYGTTSTTATVGNDARLSDSRTPSVHAASHATAGADPVSPASIGAEVTGAAAAAVAAHAALPDPHPQYLTPAEGNTLYALTSHTHASVDLSGFPLAPQFSISGPVAMTTGTYRFYNDVKDSAGTARTLSVTALRVSAGVAPTGGPITVVAKKNGGVFSTTLTASIAASSNTGVTAGAGQTLAPGDYLTIDVTLVGTTIAGSNLVVVPTMVVV